MFFLFAMAAITFVAEIAYNDSPSKYRWNHSDFAAYELRN